jgi:hypothetical protein
MSNLNISGKDISLKVKNGTAGLYRFKFRHPVNNKLIDLDIQPFSTSPVFTGELDDCSKVRLQYPAMPDNGDIALSDAPIQFVWENQLPNLDDYLGSLESAENEASKKAEESLQAALADVASNLPNERSAIEVVTVGKKKPVKAVGQELN